MPAAARSRRGARAPVRVVALGGGHGLAASLAALRHVTEDVTAVVTVADDGGSSGRLREEFGVLPPGDLRMALAALCHDSQWGHLWRDVLQHRFSGDGPLAGHSVGNLLIVALWQLLDDPVDGLRVIGDLLGAQGRVLPMSDRPLTIEADVRDPANGVTGTVRGQKEVATTAGRVGWVRLDPTDPPANPEAVRAVLEADWVVMGPGSWFTSVCPHLLVPELADALQRTTARRCVTLNLDPGTNETAGYRPEQLLEVLGAYAPGLTLDAVVADPAAVDDVDALAHAAGQLGANLVMRQVSWSDGTARHHPLRLAAAYADVFAGVTADLRR
ncbi:uridine diphosphate-N-acetylglucosamine-binding protein YvcK [Aquipuribacter nitratireducens]|uniref:Putative gluconeogenesis factor n=1 Tax=Aquipuribacter nitratireducens TaxID=650104 RepID=A0ABW0GIB4_9MICO